MKWLHCAENKLGSVGIQNLSQCVQNIETLVLHNCSFQGEDIQILTSSIQRLKAMVNFQVSRFKLCWYRRNYHF